MLTTSFRQTKAVKRALEKPIDELPNRGRKTTPEKTTTKKENDAQIHNNIKHQDQINSKELSKSIHELEKNKNNDCQQETILGNITTSRGSKQNDRTQLTLESYLQHTRGSREVRYGTFEKENHVDNLVAANTGKYQPNKRASSHGKTQEKQVTSNENHNEPAPPKHRDKPRDTTLGSQRSHLVTPPKAIKSGTSPRTLDLVTLNEIDAKCASLNQQPCSSSLESTQGEDLINPLVRTRDEIETPAYLRYKHLLTPRQTPESNATRKSIASRLTPAQKSVTTARIRTPITPPETPTEHDRYDEISPQPNQEFATKNLCHHTPTKNSVKKSSGLTNDKPSNSSAELLPAFQRFKHLLKLPLPQKFNLIQTIFEALDYVCTFYIGRGESCHYHKVRKPVEKRSDRTFEVATLGRIKVAYPESYELSNIYVTIDGARTSTMSITYPPDVKRHVISSIELRSRKDRMYNILVERVRKCHEEFLATSGHMKLETSWDPDFNLDQVPDIEIAPVIADAVKGNVESSSEFRPPTGKSNLVEAAILQAAERAKQATPKPTLTVSEISGISSALLTRVRNRVSATTGINSPEHRNSANRQAMLSKCVEICEIVHKFYTHTKKCSYNIRDVAKKISESTRTCFSEAEASSHIKLVVEVIPEWLELVKISSGTFLRMTKKEGSLKNAREAIQAELAKEAAKNL